MLNSLNNSTNSIALQGFTCYSLCMKEHIGKRVVELRLLGKTLHQIKDELGFKSANSVTQYLNRYMQVYGVDVQPNDDILFWEYLKARCSHLKDGNYSARKIFDYVKKTYMPKAFIAEQKKLMDGLYAKTEGDVPPTTFCSQTENAYNKGLYEGRLQSMERCMQLLFGCSGSDLNDKSF